MITLAAQVLCGTEPHPVRFRAKKYKVQEKSFDLVQFRLMMSHLPEHVSDAEIEEMFSFADKNNDGRISWDEFLVSAKLTLLYYLVSLNFDIDQSASALAKGSILNSVKEKAFNRCLLLYKLLATL